MISTTSISLTNKNHMSEKRSLVIIMILVLFITNSVIAQKKANLEGIEIGNPAPDIMLPDISGDTVKMSELKGKIILVSFWASWCAPCRKKSPELLEVYNEFKNTDFDNGETGLLILNVSMDRNEIAWKNAVTKDGVEDFINVGDMNGWKTTASKSYNIKTIPTNVLVDGDGEIIALNLSPKDLKKKLKKLKKSGWLWF